ncbi:hypothetical protein SAMN04487819_10494 [Actinopolyspora alba]|uniref:PE family protein n=1 Tax=Actinopolyspora alba TaxID=673379 RepID=A0A1I1VQA4_9ACTN|nr:hypothetical protein [Actinopolyspora alba]SFD85227.1 hypothetical protein SAMN04487819_10494 [Actinopolyspora alba]
MSQQNGFGVDHEKLQAVITDLEAALDEARALERQAEQSEPGELTAYDDTTEQAREAFKKRIRGEGSLNSAAMNIRQELERKINAYRAILQEYGLAEDNASVAQRETERQS